MHEKKSMPDWQPPPPNSHLVAHRTDADCQWYYMLLSGAGWLDIYFYQNLLCYGKKKEFVYFTCISHLFPYKSFTKRVLLMGTPVKVKLILIWTTSILTSFFFLRISEKLSFHAALEWNQILKLCKFSQNRSVGLWPLLLPPLCFTMAWPTYFSPI